MKCAGTNADSGVDDECEWMPLRMHWSEKWRIICEEEFSYLGFIIKDICAFNVWSLRTGQKPDGKLLAITSPRIDEIYAGVAFGVKLCCVWTFDGDKHRCNFYFLSGARE